MIALGGWPSLYGVLFKFQRRSQASGFAVATADNCLSCDAGTYAGNTGHHTQVARCAQDSDEGPWERESEWMGQGSAPESVQSQAAAMSTIHACEVHGLECGRGFNSVLQVPPTVETAALDPSPTRQVGFARG